MKKYNRRIATFLIGTMALSGISAVSLSDSFSNTAIVHAANNIVYNTSGGVVVMGTGTASITITGNAGQTLVGKEFNVYKLFDAENSKIEVEFEKADREKKIEIALSKKEKKNIKLNGIKVNKNSELLGNVNLVIFSPDDIIILKESPASRRKFLDILISQLRPNYAHLLSEYNKVLDQRNAMLKSKRTETIEIWDEQLANFADKIYEYRREYIDKIQKNIEKISSSLTNEKEKLKIKYKPKFVNKAKFIDLLKQSLNIDLIKGYTGNGIHRDDFELFVNERELNLYGSQGQHRTAILALKFAEMEIIKEEVSENPILLLDDITSELDLERISLIFEKISKYESFSLNFHLTFIFG